MPKCSGLTEEIRKAFSVTPRSRERERQLFSGYTEENDADCRRLLISLSLLIILISWARFPHIKATFFQVSLPVNPGKRKCVDDSRLFPQCEALESNVCPGSGKTPPKATFIQVQGNLYPGNRPGKATFIQVQSNLYPGAGVQ